MKFYPERTIHPFVFCFLMALGISCSADSSLDFDIPGGDASVTLWIFAEQAQVEILFDDRNISNYTTNKVQGTLTPLKALEVMTKDTGLNFYHDESSNAFAVSSDEET